MIQTIIGLLLISFTQSFELSKTSINELDLLNAYHLQIGSITLFGDISSQINAWGLPSELSYSNESKKFKTKKDVLLSVQQLTDYTTIKYPGLELWCFPDLETIPHIVDFRTLGKNLYHDDIVFNSEYSLDNFKKDFPKSYTNSPKVEQSFFSLIANRHISDENNFYLERKTKSDKYARPLVEFTFSSEKLIYIVFVNF